MSKAKKKKINQTQFYQYLFTSLILFIYIIIRAG